MFSSKEFPSASSMFSAYASMAASLMLVRSMANELVPHPIRGFLLSSFRHFFKFQSPKLTLIIDESTGMTRNLVYDAAAVYLCTKISATTERLKVNMGPKEKHFTIRLDKGEKVVDFFDGVELKWRLVCSEPEKNNPNDPYNYYSRSSEKRYFELCFDKKHQEIVLSSYLPFILEKAKAIRDQKRDLKMYTLNNYSPAGNGFNWASINLEHPATFETLAMDPDQKNAVIEDLNRFVRRKEFYKKVGRAWKRGYLLYGPPGTGKSSLVAAMANYLKFDIYDLQLANVYRDSELRKLLLSTANKSILVIEDIDCSVDVPDRQNFHGNGVDFVDQQDNKMRSSQLTLSGLLNFIDGLWSTCGDERIIVFTTNHKDRLDPALLRPGRMDMHIHMSYCTYHGFKLLASNYLGINDHHELFAEIESLLNEAEVTPAQVAEEMMKSEDADFALGEIVKLLKRKKMEDDESDEGDRAAEINGGTKGPKRQRIDNGGIKGPKRHITINKYRESPRSTRNSIKIRRVTL